MTKNTKLHARMFEKGVTQRELSSRTGIPRPYLSLAVHGRFNFDDDERQAIAEALGLPVNELFPPIF